MNIKRTLLAILTGMAAGAALGILFAPSKGSVTRRKIAGSAKDMAGNIKEQAEKGRGVFTDLKEKLFRSESHNGERTDQSKDSPNI